MMRFEINQFNAISQHKQKLVRDFITVNAANGNNVNCSMLYAMFMNIITVTLKQREVKR